jgi:L-threonylcarbamoyladenylate synthase
VNDRTEARGGAASSALDDAARAVLGGELVVLPTDTVYGLGSRPDDPRATDRLFDVKRRPRGLELPVLAPSADVAWSVARRDDRAEDIARAAWPGPVTLVLPRAPASAGWRLGGNGDTVGIRVPRHPLALALLERTGPLAVTSANISGEPTPIDWPGLESVFGDAVAVYVCQEEDLVGTPSTVLDLVHGEPRVLRRGALDDRRLELLLARHP